VEVQYGGEKEHVFLLLIPWQRKLLAFSRPLAMGSDDWSSIIPWDF
jgi:hypothetical protein